MGADRWCLGSMQNLWKVRQSPGPDPNWCHGYRGHRRRERLRAHGVYGHDLGHHTVAGPHCGALICLAATQNERAQ